MEIDRAQLDYICNVTESIYTVSITAKENKLRSNMRRLRQLFRNSRVKASSVSRETLSSCLWFAVLDQDAASVRDLVRRNADVNLARCSINMLWMAVIRGDVHIATMLVEAGADVNARIAEAAPTFLHYFVIATTRRRGDDVDYRNLELARLMIARGADVNARADGYSVLQLALLHDAVMLVKLLLDNEAQMEGSDLIPLAAQSSQSCDLLRTLANRIDDAELRCTWVFGALQYLIGSHQTYDYLNEIGALLSLHLPVLDMDIEGLTILRVALYFEKIHVIKLLLEYGADVNKKSARGDFPLMWAVSSKNVAMVKLFIEHGANVNEHNDDGRYALHQACQMDLSKIIDLLIGAGAKVNVYDNDKSTPFSLLGNKTLTQSHRYIIRHMAQLALDDDDLCNVDLEKIRRCTPMLVFYDDCLTAARKSQ